MSQRSGQPSGSGEQRGPTRVEPTFELRLPLGMLSDKGAIDQVSKHLKAISNAKHAPPCEGGILVRVVGTTTECTNHIVVFVDTVEWICPPDNHIVTTQERTPADAPC
jgi:hypothetical protein